MAEPPETTSRSWRNYTRYQWTALITFGIVNFVSAMIYSIQAPFYPDLAESKNATATEIGIVFGSYELTAFIMCPLLGSYMYKIGPKNGFSMGVLIAGISMILFGFLNKIKDHIYFVLSSLLLRMLQGTGTSALFVSIYSFVTLEFPNSVAATFALMETAFGFGMCVGPVVGEIFFQIGGFTLPFVALGGFLVISPFASHFLLVKPVDSADAEIGEVNNNGSRYGGIFHLIKIPTILVIIFGTFIGGFTVGFVSASLEPHIRQFQLSPALTALMFLSYGAVYALVGPLFGFICDRISEPGYITVVGSFLVMVGFTAIGPAAFIPITPIAWVTAAGLVIFGVGLGALYVSTFLLTLKEAMKNDYPDTVATYGLVSGLWMSALSLGACTGPIAGGLLQDHFGFRNAIYCIFALTFLLTLFVLVTIVKRRSWAGYKEDETSDGRSLINSAGLIWDDENIGETVLH